MDPLLEIDEPLLADMLKVIELAREFVPADMLYDWRHCAINPEWRDLIDLDLLERRIRDIAVARLLF